MVDRNLLREFDVSDDELGILIDGEDGSSEFDRFIGEGQNFDIGGIVSGKVIEVVGDQVVVDVGYKSEGLVPLNEWDEEAPPRPGDAVEVLLEGMEDQTGEIVLSRRKAIRMRAWEMVISKYHEGDVVAGLVTKKIKGGLLVDIGVNVFLPASQVDIRRPSDIGDYINQTIECMILKIDEGRRNIVVSRRKLIEITRETLAQIAAGNGRGSDMIQQHFYLCFALAKKDSDAIDAFRRELKQPRSRTLQDILHTVGQQGAVGLLTAGVNMVRSFLPFGAGAAANPGDPTTTTSASTTDK